MVKSSLFKPTSLGDVLKFFNGKSIKPGGDGQYPVYGSNGLIGRSDEYTHQNGLIIGRVGAYCGAIRYCQTHFWASDNTIVGQPKDISFDIRYIYYLLRELNLNRYAGGSAQPLLTQTVLRQVQTSIPPLLTQQKIAAVLSAYDDLIENNTRRIEILEEMAGAIYREWFVEFRFPEHEQVEMVESELGLIPQGWKVGILGDLAESVRRNIKPSDINQETPYFGLEHLPRKSIALSDWDVVDSINSAKLAFKKGEILFGKIRPYFHKVGVAPLDGICSSDTIVIRPKRNECFAMTLSCVSSEHFIEYATMTSQGTKMPRADWKVLVKYPVIIPPDQISQRFSSFVRDIVNQIQSLIFRNRNLRQTRDLLLPKIISGEIDVSELNIDTN